jgi:hypothetical protein
MAAGIWSLSAWDTYSVAKQYKKAAAICRSMTDKSMPPASVQKANPETVPTEEQISIVCKWSKSLPKK